MADPHKRRYPKEPDDTRSSGAARAGRGEAVEAERRQDQPEPCNTALLTKPDLWHFTCEHGRRSLGKRGLLVAPLPHPFIGARLIWLTTEATPDRERTGLTMNLQRCDRMAYRYRVLQPERCMPWLGSPFRIAAAPAVVDDLESFGDPEHWWVTTIPTLAVLAP